MKRKSSRSKPKSRTEETEGLIEDDNAAEGTAGETDADGRKRKRRRRRRGRSGEAREGTPPVPREDGEFPVAAAAVVDGVEAIGDDSEGDEDESDDQPGEARTDAPADGERRPRRRGRRGGRRRRGGPEDGLAGSISDELGPIQVSEASEAVADLEGHAEQQHEGTSLHPHDEAVVEAITSRAEPEPQQASAEPAVAAAKPEPVAAPATVVAPTPAAAPQDDDRAAARRRSTVREKVSFASAEPQPVAAPAVAPVAAEPAPAPQPVPEPAAAPAATETQPRKAGWWSRAFGNGE